MSSLTILLIRHAEKPDDPGLGPGLTVKGNEDKHSLVIRGWQRSGTWAALFGSGAIGTDFPKPDAVYAADPDKPPTADGSVTQRPYETVIPLCERLHINPVTTHGVGDETALVNEVQRMTGTALICWEHKRIVEATLPALAGTQTLPRLPTKWDGARFDVVLRFNRIHDGAQWSFCQLFPRLLAGDTDVPI